MESNNNTNKFWYFFDQLCQIPRPSKHEEKIAEWLEQFAKKRNLVCKHDSIGNTVIYKNGIGEPIALQAHTDMVCEKLVNTNHDFNNDAIKTYIEDGWIKAEDTTLGADDGIGCAYMLALLDSDIVTRPLECLFTVDEETGLTGAFNLDTNLLQSKQLINLDSENEDTIFVGCAGGCDTLIELPIETEEVKVGWFGVNLSIKGLLGGHSGEDINKKRANAVKILGDFLYHYRETHKFRIVEINAGGLINAIAREASVIVAVPFKEKETIRIEWNIYCASIEDEWLKYESNIQMDLDSNNKFKTMYSQELTDSILNIVHYTPHGPIEFYNKEFVDLSTNLAYIKTNDESIIIGTSQRSANASKKRDLSNQIVMIAANYGAMATRSHEYPGWEPRFDSPLAKKATDAYNEVLGFKPQVKSIHAGLECGLFLQKYPNLDMISIGPTMMGVHTPSEKLLIKSAENIFQVIKKLIID